MKPVLKHVLLGVALLPLLAVAAPRAADAQGPSIFEIKRSEEGMPPLSEYDNIPPGLMIAPEESSKIAENLTEVSHDNSKDPKMPRVEFNYNQCMEMYLEGKYEEIFPSLEILAAGGHRPAEELLGIMYRLGQGTEKNGERAKKLLTSAANADRPVAQHHLGIMYYLGEGGDKNLIESLTWLQLATILYPDGPERKQAESDRDQVMTGLTRRERDTALGMAREWLQKRGMGHLMDMR
jgi:TPR repeat protein